MHQTIDFVREPKKRMNRWIFVFLAAAIVIIIGSGTALSYYVDLLWFGTLGYRDVFLRTWGLEWGVLAGFFAATFLVLYGWFLVLWRMHADDMPFDRAIFLGRQQLRLPFRRVLRGLGVLLSLGIAVVAGATMMAEWTTFALYWASSAQPHGTPDPVFGKPLTFYLFVLPVWQLVVDWLITLAVIACVAAMAFVAVGSANRALLKEKGSIGPTVPWRGVSIAFAVFLLVLAVQVYLARFGTLLDVHTIFGGVNYTEAHVTITGSLFVAAALVLGAAIAASNVFRRPRGMRLIAAIVPAVGCYVLVQVVGWYVGNFIVKPNQLERERPYIAWNIDWTRRGWDLDRVSQQEFPADTTPVAADPANNQSTLQNIRLWDWHALQDTLRQIQEIRTYYDFPDIDIDRYTINGQMREVMLAARELSVEKLADELRRLCAGRGKLLAMAERCG